MAADDDRPRGERMRGESAAPVADNPLGAFLRARREQLAPEQAGFADDYRRRRVPGLRREELALLAGVSAPYYARLEQGRDRRPSAEVLDALARALQLDGGETRHLHALAVPPPARRSRVSRQERISDPLRRLLERHVDVPAYIYGATTEVLAGNRLAALLHPSFQQGRNLIRDFFLDDEARAVYLPADHARIAFESVSILRSVAARDVDDPRMTELVGELSLKSDEFRRLWARHQVRDKVPGTKRFRHPLLGELTLDYEAFTVAGADRQLLLVFHAVPGSDSERSLKLLTTLAAEPRSAAAAPATAGAAVAQSSGLAIQSGKSCENGRSQ